MGSVYGIIRLTAGQQHDQARLATIASAGDVVRIRSRIEHIEVVARAGCQLVGAVDDRPVTRGRTFDPIHAEVVGRDVA